MSASERIRAAAAQLSAQLPFDKISFADVGKAAGVHWTAVRRHFGSKQEMRRWLESLQSDDPSALQDTRTKILEAAARVFARHGYAGASLELVAADAGMTKGAVYWHFSSKSDLFAALCEHHLSRQLLTLPQVGRAALQQGPDAQAGFAALLEELVCCAPPDSPQPMLFFEFVTASRDPRVADALREAYSQIIGRTSAVIKGWQDDKLLNADVDPEVIAILLQSLIHGLTIGSLIDKKRLSLPALFPELAKLLWSGLPHKESSAAPQAKRE